MYIYILVQMSQAPVRKDPFAFMSNYIEKAENLKLPVVVLNGTVAFPSVKLNLEITEAAGIAAVQAACATNSFVLLVAARDIVAEGTPEVVIYNEYFGATPTVIVVRCLS